ncbi:MAG: translocation/assembly module TamB domain-containing protein, partial [Bacteroidaceae bacterium]|nr:translocation/assembly module TamB domain-containing protein [Bacteroidaceae bacterium]
MKKIGFWIAGLALTPVALILILTVLLYIPPVQNWAVRKVAAYASEKTGMTIRLERLRLSPLLDLDLQHLSVTNPDTLLAVEHVVVDLDFTPILTGRLGVEALDINNGTVNTQDLIATLVIQGRLGNFHLNADDISLKKHTVNLTTGVLDSCDIDIALRDTTVIDTTESAPIPWNINVCGIEAHDTRVAFHTVRDSMCVKAGVRDLLVKGGDINLEESIYKVKHIQLDADSVSYDLTYEPDTEGFDYNHISLNDIKLGIEDFYYNQPKNELSMHLTQCQGIEQGGIEISSLTSHVTLDDNRIQLPDFRLTTPYSDIGAKVFLDWASLSPNEGGKMDIDLNASLGKSDILTFAAPYLSKEQKRLIPDEPVSLAAQVQGNIDSLHIGHCRLMSSPMIDAQTQGDITQVLNPDQMGADLNWDIQTYDLNPVKQLIGLGNSVRLPQMHLTGTTSMHNEQYSANLLLHQGQGTARLKGDFNGRTEAYNANLDIRNLNLHNFLPKDSLYTLTARATANGRGTDLLSRNARAKADARIEHLQYGKNNLDDIHLTADLNNGDGQVNLYSNNDILRADACAELKLDKKVTYTNFSLSLSRIDLYSLGLTQQPLRASMLLQMDGNSNLEDTHQLKGSIKAVELALRDTVYYPLDVDLDLLMSPDTIFAEATAGDLEMRLISHEGLDQILTKADLLSTEVKRQLAVHHLAQDTLKSLLPQLSLHMKSGRNNPVGRSLATLGYSYERLFLTLDSDPTMGLNGKGYVHGLNTGAVLLDTIQWNIYQDSTDVVRLGAMVKNGPKNKQVVFESNLAAELTPIGANATINFFDANGQKGVDLGAQLAIEDDGYRLHLHPLHPTIAYRGFTLNDDNFIYLRDDRHIEANVDLLADDGTGFQLYSTPNEDALQDITLSVHDFNLGELSAVIPYMPDINGVLKGDFHLVQDENSMSVLIDANINSLAYEGVSMGDIGLNAVYLPNTDGTHYVDGIVSQNGNEVLMLAGTYNPENGGSIDAGATLNRLPLELANGFIPDQTAGLTGYVAGNLDVTGPVSAPVLNGSIITDSMHINSDMYSLHLRFPDDTIRIVNSYLDLKRIEAYSTGKNPLVLDGTIDFRHPERIALNLRLFARDFELINSPKTPKAVAYGKVYVDIGAMLTGTLNDMQLRGKLAVLGNTNVTYVLTDSPLTVEDQLADLVTFVDFSDTTTVETIKTAPQNIDITLNIGIEQAAQVHCLLSTDGTNHIDLEGGGDLTMTYSTQDGTHLYGRYTIVNGLMNYSLMIVALKNFTIANGSYVEFTGDMMNPRLNISASERVKTTVYENNVPRSVNFDVGLTISQTLENMGLEFTLEAPSDITISNQLATMSAEERGKVAVTMLATGMYLTESGNGTSGFSATNALNS